MWVEKVRLSNIRSFMDETIELSKSINVLVGTNNSGKSTIAYTVLEIPRLRQFSSPDIRLGENTSTIEIFLKEAPIEYYETENLIIRKVIDKVKSNIDCFLGANKAKSPFQPTPSAEPNNFIYPFLSKRKVGNYDEQINSTIANSVSENFSNLYSKVDKMITTYRSLPAYGLYEEYCKKILGFKITTEASGNGKKACYIKDLGESILMDKMGEGVPNILGLLVDLCRAKGKLFVIEEPENDIHPKALKALMDLIIEKSTVNQFLITTHSNIVVRYLGAKSDTKVYWIDMELNEAGIPTSKSKLVENNPEARRGLIEYLGYEFIDLDLWQGWLFFEESSAEEIVRDHLIRWFAPELQSKLRTFSANSVDEVEPKFNDFNVLFSYLHLEPMYKHRVWVIIYGGDKEENIVKKLKENYLKSGWGEDHFQQFKEHDFEKYYPEQFQAKVNDIITNRNANKKRKQKQDLLHEVKEWIKKDDKVAKAEFEKSAGDVISRLTEIKDKLLATK